MARREREVGGQETCNICGEEFVGRGGVRGCGEGGSEKGVIKEGVRVCDKGGSEMV